MSLPVRCTVPGPDEEAAMLSSEPLRQYRERGFVRGGRVLDEGQIEELRAEVERVVADRDDASKPQPVRLVNMGKPEHPVWQIVNIWQASDAFFKLVSNPVITEEAAQL